jgi:polysaccharide biosynthesis/export protein
MMKMAILTVLLTVGTALTSFGFQDPKPAQESPPAHQPPPKDPVPAQQPPLDPSKPPDTTKPPEGVKPPAGQVATPPVETDPVKMASPAVTAPTVQGGISGDKDYIIGVEDVLAIQVWANGALSGSCVVRPDGKITIGLINDIVATGLTPMQLGTQIGEKLKEAGILKTPQITVTVVAINSKKFQILGEIGKPGSYSVIQPTTVLEALVNAGGFNAFANKRNIIIQRGDKRFKFNYNEVIKGKKTTQNILVQPKDLIIVH